MIETQPYTINALRYVHDDRGRYCPQGSVAWLRPSRATKIVEEMRERGVVDALSPAESSELSTRSRSALPPSQRSTQPAPGHFQAESAPDLIKVFLKLHHTRRRKAARLLGATGKISTKQADSVIKAAEPAKLERLAAELGV